MCDQIQRRVTLISGMFRSNNPEIKAITLTEAIKTTYLDTTAVFSSISCDVNWPIGHLMVSICLDWSGSIDTVKIRWFKAFCSVIWGRRTIRLAVSRSASHKLATKLSDGDLSIWGRMEMSAHIFGFVLCDIFVMKCVYRCVLVVTQNQTTMCCYVEFRSIKYVNQP